MRSFVLLLLAVVATTLNVRLEAQKATIPSVGMHITKTILVAPGHYALPTPDTNSIQKQGGVIVIEGKNIVLHLHPTNLMVLPSKSNQALVISPSKTPLSKDIKLALKQTVLKRLR